MENVTTEAIFISGLYLDRVHEKAPAFIITNQTIHVEKLIQWLQEHKNLANEKGYIKIQGKESKTLDDKGIQKRYFQVDTYKKPEDTTSVLPEYPSTPLDDSSIPF